MTVITTYLFSPSARGFYVQGLHTAIPEDCVQVSAAQHSALMDAQSNGMEITFTDGSVVAVPPAPPSVEVVAALKRGERNRRLEATDWIVLRHRDELEIAVPTTLSAEDFEALLFYRQALRDITEQPSFPAIDFPATPSINGMD